MVEQAVVLCGGLGERLRPFTDSLPKAMVDVAGRPFLEILIEQLAEQGVERFVLCTGYRGESIREHFGDGSLLGTEITYSEGPTSWSTARRLHEAESMLDETFLLMYSDNFAAIDLVGMFGRHIESGAKATLTIVRKPVGNVSVSGHGVAYSRRRSDASTHVEVGYMLVERDPTFDTLDGLAGSPNVELADVLVALSDSDSLDAVEAFGGYQSISDPERLERTREFMSPKRILLVDRDGTINEKSRPGEYVTRWEDFSFIEEAVDAMAQLAEEGFEFAVITNQAGIAREMVDSDELERIHQGMVSTLDERGIAVRGVYVSPHHWDEEAFDRKPNPGLFYRASQELGFRLDRVVYVGDDIRDCRAAASAGCGMVYITSEGEDGQMPVSRMPQWTVRTFCEAMPVIREFYEGFER